MELGYARVSTTKQDLERQLDALNRYGIPDTQLYVDKKTGATTDRPGLTALLGYARDGDTIVATTLDRLGRNLRDCLNMVHELRERGIGIKTLKDPLPIDTTDDSAMGQIAVAMLSLFSEIERVFALERAAHARAVREARGAPVGRKRKLTPDQLDAAATQVRGGVPVAQVAKTFQMSRASMYRLLAERSEATTAATSAAEPEATQGDTREQPGVCVEPPAPTPDAHGPSPISTGQHLDYGSAVVDPTGERGTYVVTVRGEVSGSGRDTLLGYITRSGRLWKAGTPEGTAPVGSAAASRKAAVRALVDHHNHHRHEAAPAPAESAPTPRGDDTARKVASHAAAEPRAVKPRERIDLDSIRQTRTDSGMTRVEATTTRGTPVLVGFLERGPRHRKWEVRTPYLTVTASGFRTRQDALLRLIESHAPPHR